MIPKRVIGKNVTYTFLNLSKESRSGDAQAGPGKRFTFCLLWIDKARVEVEKWIVYYKSRKWEVKIRLMNERWCDERLKTRVEESKPKWCLLWIVKARAKDKIYTWMSVRWKTKNWSWGIYTPRMPSGIYILLSPFFFSANHTDSTGRSNRKVQLNKSSTGSSGHPKTDRTAVFLVCESLRVFQMDVDEEFVRYHVAYSTALLTFYDFDCWEFSACGVTCGVDSDMRQRSSRKTCVARAQVWPPLVSPSAAS